MIPIMSSMRLHISLPRISGKRRPEDLQGCDAILVPGGFAYGDYLRTGAIAKFEVVMQSVCDEVCEERRSGAGNLQRVSDSL